MGSSFRMEWSKLEMNAKRNSNEHCFKMKMDSIVCLLKASGVREAHRWHGLLQSTRFEKISLAATICENLLAPI